MASAGRLDASREVIDNARTMPAYGVSIFGAVFPELQAKLFGKRSGNDVRLSIAERQLKMADLLALAVLADGKVTDAEWAALERLGDPDAVIAWRRRAVDLTDAETLKATARLLAAPLDRKERRAVMEWLDALIEAGAGVPREGGSYRRVAPADGERLRSLFREALELDKH